MRAGNGNEPEKGMSYGAYPVPMKVRLNLLLGMTRFFVEQERNEQQGGGTHQDDVRRVTEEIESGDIEQAVADAQKTDVTPEEVAAEIEKEAPQGAEESESVV